MDRKEALKIIEETKTDYSQKNRILQGLQILVKYCDNLDRVMAFEHDQIYVVDFETSVAQMTREEVVELATLGWIESEESWSHF